MLSFLSQQTSMQQKTIRPVRQTQRPTVSSPAPDSKNGIEFAISYGRCWLGKGIRLMIRLMIRNLAGGAGSDEEKSVITADLRLVKSYNQCRCRCRCRVG